MSIEELKQLTIGLCALTTEDLYMTDIGVFTTEELIQLLQTPNTARGLTIVINTELTKLVLKTLQLGGEEDEQ